MPASMELALKSKMAGVVFTRLKELFRSDK